MKLYEAFFLTLLCSLLAGALLFLGIPLTGYFGTGDSHDHFLDSRILTVLLIFYGIYAAIQLLLSVINLIQVVHLRTSVGIDIEQGHLMRNFLVSEFILYAIIFVIMVALVPAPEMVGIVFVFSIPYVICCTNSIFLFRYFLRKLLTIDVGTPI